MKHEFKNFRLEVKYRGKTAGRENPFGVLRSPGSPSRPSCLSWTYYNPFAMFIQPYVDAAHLRVARFDAVPLRAKERQEGRASHNALKGITKPLWAF